MYRDKVGAGFNRVAFWPWQLRADWLASESLKPESLVACKMTGDSMMPGLNNGDTVLIDTSRTQPKDGRVFAINYEGELVIKRLMRDAGNWWLSSDNTDKTRYPNKLCAGDVCLIIGECVHKQSTVI
jgi:Predicted transcriptional regulator